jgi:transcriptional regulator of acetoin/glycerol metabolism
LRVLDAHAPERHSARHPTAQQPSLRQKPPTFAEIEKQILQIALDNNNGSVLKASQELEIARQTMYNKMQKYNL